MSTTDEPNAGSAEESPRSDKASDPPPLPPLSAKSVSRSERAALEAETLPPVWGLPKKLLFRFALLYFLLYAMPFAVTTVAALDVQLEAWFETEIIPNDVNIGEKYQGVWREIVPWVGDKVFGLDITIFPAGSGDTTYNYVEILVFASAALLLALIWSFLFRRTRNHRVLAWWLWTGARYYVGMYMLIYGFAKIFPGQFRFPPPETLMQQFGDASPMRILWFFMGFSETYTQFAGWGEAIGGFLLFFRRTVSLGAVILVAVLSNVVMLNYCYDVPVKLFSSHLLVMAFAILLPDLRRLFRVFVLNRATKPRNLTGPIPYRFVRGALVVVKLAFVGYLLYSHVEQGRKMLEFQADQPVSPFAGAWTVESYTQDGEERPPLLTDPDRWQNLVFYSQWMSVRRMDDRVDRFAVELDESAGTLVVAKFFDQEVKFELTYAEPEEDKLVIEGELDGNAIRVELVRRKFPLLERGFHWINERPNNS